MKIEEIFHNDIWPVPRETQEFFVAKQVLVAKLASSVSVIVRVEATG